mgnify:CR=1 FL=1
MIPREMDTTQLVDWIRDCIAVAEVASDRRDKRLYSDALEKLRELVLEYRQRVAHLGAIDSAS